MRTIVYLIFAATIMLFSCKTKKEVVSSKTPTTQLEQNKPRQKKNDGAIQQERIEELYSKLDLTEVQMTQFDAINEKYSEEFKVVRDSNNGDRMVMREKMRSINQRKNEEVKSILNEGQFKLYQEFLEERKNSRMKRRGNRR